MLHEPPLSHLKTRIYFVNSWGDYLIFCEYIIAYFRAISAVIYTVFFNGNNHKSLKLQRKLPTTPIRLLQEGVVEIQGRVQMITPLLSRLDQTPCVGYTYHKFLDRTDSDGDISTETLESHEEVNTFVIQDSSGGIEVSAKDLTLMWLPKEEVK